MLHTRIITLVMLMCLPAFACGCFILAAAHNVDPNDDCCSYFGNGTGAPTTRTPGLPIKMKGSSVYVIGYRRYSAVSISCDQ
jgi:hypothetical protein